MRKLKGKTAIFVNVVAIIASLFHIYTAAFGLLDPRLQRGFHLLFLIPLAFLLFPATKKSPQDSISKTDILLAFLALLPSMMIVIDNSRINQRWEHITPLLTKEIILGFIMIVLLIEAVRRAVTPVLSYVIIVALGYIVAGPIFPGIFFHQGISLKGLIETMFLLADEGIYGMLTGVSATYIYIFVLFGAFVVNSGAGDFFTKIATAVAGRVKGGPALIAVLSSAFFGTLTGSSTANVFGTGSFTIPLMKKVGYEPEFAGAVEAAASTGGQYMPPIMGAVAFVMAEIVGVPYITIALCASISAVLYFMSIGFMVYFRACKDELEGLETEEIPSVKEAMKSSYLIIPIIVLFYMLVKGYSPIAAGFYSSLFMIAITWLNPKKGMRLKEIVDALIDGGKNAILVAAACAGTGMIVSVVTHTGLGLSFSNALVNLSKGNIIITMGLIMIAALILGHGAPTTATYVLVATVGANALIRLGADVIAAHLFCLYYAVIADITPPVAVAAYAGASIANGDPLKTGLEAFKLAIAGFIVPFMFVLNPALVLRGPITTTIHATITALIGIVLLSGAIQGWFTKNLSIIERLVLLTAAFLLIKPGLFSDAIGIVVLLIFFVQKKLWKRKTTTQRNIVND